MLHSSLLGGKVEGLGRMENEAKCQKRLQRNDITQVDFPFANARL